MTEVLEAQTERGSDVKRISHWIGGRSVAGESGRSGPVFNPATGQQSGAVDFASAEEVDRAVKAAREAFPGWRSTSLSKRRTCSSGCARRSLAPRGFRAHPHRRARQGALRRARRGRARARGGRVRLRRPAPAQGRVLGAGLDRHRRLLDPPAPRRRRRHHAVQLPGDGAHVDVRAGHRLRQHVRAEAVREGPVRAPAHRRAAHGGRAPRRRLQRRPRRQGRGRRAARPSGRRRRQRSWARRRWRRYIYERGTKAASASRRSPARRTT